MSFFYLIEDIVDHAINGLFMTLITAVFVVLSPLIIPMALIGWLFGPEP